MTLMTRAFAPALLLCVCAMAFVTSCGGPAQTPAQRVASAAPAVQELQAGDFEGAARSAERALAADAANPQARLVRAVTTYKKAAHELFGVMRSAMRGRFDESVFARTHEAAVKAEAALANVDLDLEAAERDPTVALELCPACWKEIDWNHDGRVDERDRRLLELEEDANGEPIPEGDPRRQPTFRFDIGDVHWARAMVAFQRAALDVVLVYRWRDVLAVKDERAEFTIHVDDASRAKQAKARILEGLDASDRSRVAYLAETDDDREWVPNPRQKSHPLPLPVDDALYQTWEGVVSDVRRLVRGEEGIDLREVAELAHRGSNVPHGFVDIGRLLSSPQDLRIDITVLDHLRRDPERALRMLFGAAYVTQMRPSGLPRRLERMHHEVERGEERLERKLRYLLWLN